MAKFGIRVAQDGKDAGKASDGDIIMSSDFNLPKVKIFKLTRNLITDAPTETVYISHDQIDPPEFFVWVEENIPAFSQRDKWMAADRNYVIVRDGNFMVTFPDNIGGSYRIITITIYLVQPTNLAQTA